MAKLVSRAPRLYRARRIDLGKFVTPMERPAGVNQGARIGDGGIGALFRRQPRVGRRCPGAVDDLDRGRGIRPGQDRPPQLLQIRNVDVVIDHHHIPVGVVGGAALQGDMAGLLGVARIALLDGDAVQ